MPSARRCRAPGLPDREPDPGGTGTRDEDWAARAEASEGTGAPAPCEDGGPSPEAAGGRCTLGRVQESPGSGRPGGTGPAEGAEKHLETRPDGRSLLAPPRLGRLALFVVR